MTTFDERERAFEARFAHDEELRFRAISRRNKLVGVWAAGQLGRTGEDTEAYSRAVVRAGLEGHGDGAVMAKLRHDFDAANVPISDEQIRRTMREMLLAAAEQVSSE